MALRDSHPLAWRPDGGSGLRARRGGQGATSALSAISIHHFHGAATRVDVRDTAFGIRREHFMVELIASWPSGDAARHRARAEAAADRLRPLSLPGGYANLLGPDHRQQIAHAYGPNADRLLAVKASVDPDNVFSAIPLPAAGSAPDLLEPAVGEA
jgi:hypothetical protein